jgi:hypothetical protein
MASARCSEKQASRSGDQRNYSPCGYLHVHTIRAHGKRATQSGGGGCVLARPDSRDNSGSDCCTLQLSHRD